MTTQDDWELSKENVQPLREGRKMSSLTAALNSGTDKEAEQEIRAMQNEYEMELRTYSGSDPFDVWDRYIKWTEQYYPKGGHDGQLTALIERCLKEFQRDEHYKNDPRFIRVWIKFANASDDPSVVYSHMFDNGVGLRVAAFYCEWALSLERNGDTRGADAIYVEGKNRLAQPKETLVQMHDQFQHRLVSNIRLQMADDANPGMDFGEGEDRRQVLGRLKANKKAQVGTTRTGSISSGSAGTVSASKPKQIPGNKLQIFCDENAEASARLQPTNEWKSIPVRSEINRENDKPAGVWSGAKLKQKAPAAAAPNFQIHEDEESDQPAETPRKTTLINIKPLSAIKPPKYLDAFNLMAAPVQGVPNLNEGLPKYDKARVYNGIHEFQFEELRAIKYFQNLKLRKEQEEREAERKKAEETARKLEEMAERMTYLESQLNNLSNPSNHPSIEENSRELSNRSATSVSNAMSRMVTPTNESNHIPIASGSNRRQNVSLNSSQRTPIFNSALAYPNLSTASSGGSAGRSNLSSNSGSFSHCQNKKLTSRTEASKESANSSLRSSTSNSLSYQITPKTKSNDTTKSNGPSPENTRSFTKRGITAPSPTLHTKEAMMMIGQMFSSSFNNESMATLDILPNQVNQAAGGVPFQICEDQTGVIPPAAAVGMEIYCDEAEGKENQGTRSANQLSENQENQVQPKGFAIFCDENENANTGKKPKGLQIHSDLAEPKPSTTKKGLSLQIYNDEVQEYQENNTGVKKTARRGLGFMNSCSSTDDVDMTGFAKDLIDEDFTIECGARDDRTLAGLDKFTVLAQAASTPYTEKSSFFPFRFASATPPEASSLASSVSDATFGELPRDNQHLSPILEGSGEESKSHASSSVSTISSTTQRSRHASTLSNPQPIIEDEEKEAHDSSMIDAEVLDATCGHLIDMSNYVPNEDEEHLSSSQRFNPFDESCIANILAGLDPPLSKYSHYNIYNELAPNLSDSQYLVLGSKYLLVEKEIGQGGYAKVFKAMENSFDLDDDTDIMDTETENEKDKFPQIVLKIQSPPCPWEFYINHELHRRLRRLNAPMDVTPSVVSVEAGHFYRDTSILQLQFIKNGSLLNLVNKYKSDRQLLQSVEPFACLLTVELLHMFEQIHAARVIHGDVKPDNFLLRNLPYLCENPSREEVFGSQTQLLSLIDFGQGIDMEKFPPHTTFTAKVKTSGFQCIEMRTNRPWTYQTDLFGLAGTVHVVLLGLYMNVFQENGQWRTTANFNRKWNVSLWKEFFSTMLNIPSCGQLPDLAAMRHKFEEYFLTKLSAYNVWVSDIKSADFQL